MQDLFTTIETVDFIKKYFDQDDWYMINRDLRSILEENLSSKKVSLENIAVTGKVYIGDNTIVGPFTYIEGPVYIGDNVEIGPNVHIRPGSVISDNCVVGHAANVKNSVMMAGSKTSNHTLVADSILGVKARVAGHSETANRRFDQGEISWNMKDATLKTGLDKLGAIIGEESRIGGSVMLSPGTVIGMKTFIATGSVIKGYIEANKFVRLEQGIQFIDNKFKGKLHNRSKLYG